MHPILIALKTELEADGVASYCQQVCGGGECGSGRICHHGIDPQTEMPAAFQLSDDEAIMIGSAFADHAI